MWIGVLKMSHKLDKGICRRINGKADALPGCFNFSVCVWIMDEKRTQVFEMRCFWIFRTNTIWEDIWKKGQEWAFPARLGLLKTGQGGKGLYPDDLPKNRIEFTIIYNDETTMSCLQRYLTIKYFMLNKHGKECVSPDFSSLRCPEIKTAFILWLMFYFMLWLP